MEAIKKVVQDYVNNNTIDQIAMLCQSYNPCERLGINEEFEDEIEDAMNVVLTAFVEEKYKDAKPLVVLTDEDVEKDEDGRATYNGQDALYTDSPMDGCVILSSLDTIVDYVGENKLLSETAYVMGARYVYYYDSEETLVDYFK